MNPIDLTSIINEIISGVGVIIGTVFLAWLRSHMKDKAAAEVLGNAIKNSIGAIQQGGKDVVGQWKPVINIPGVSPELAIGVQYVLNNAGDELQRFTSITPEVIAEKIQAQIGLKAVDTNIAVAGSPVPVVPLPLAPLATVKVVPGRV